MLCLNSQLKSDGEIVLFLLLLNLYCNKTLVPPSGKKKLFPKLPNDVRKLKISILQPFKKNV